MDDPKDNLSYACLQIVDDDMNLIIPWYIMSMYAKDELGETLLDEKVLDKLRNRMLQYWDKIEHRYKSFISLEDVREGNKLEDYPTYTFSSVKVLWESYYGKERKISRPDH